MIVIAPAKRRKVRTIIVGNRSNTQRVCSDINENPVNTLPTNDGTLHGYPEGDTEIGVKRMLDLGAFRGLRQPSHGFIGCCRLARIASMAPASAGMEKVLAGLVETRQTLNLCAALRSPSCGSPVFSTS